MPGLLDAVVDLGFGSSCTVCGRPGRLLCRDCRETLPATPVPARPVPCPDGLAEVMVAGEYADDLRALVLALKERRAWSLARPLGDLLAVAVSGFPPEDGTEVIVVPVPSRPSVVRVRGHDPTSAMARFAASRLRGDGREVRTVPLLRLTGAVADQSGLDAARRFANLAGSMGARGGALQALARRGRAVQAVVADDIVTTGATAREAQRVLEAVGIPVLGIAAVAATRRRLPEFGGSH